MICQWGPDIVTPGQNPALTSRFIAAIALIVREAKKYNIKSYLAHEELARRDHLPNGTWDGSLSSFCRSGEPKWMQQRGYFSSSLETLTIRNYGPFADLLQSHCKWLDSNKAPATLPSGGHQMLLC